MILLPCPLCVKCIFRCVLCLPDDLLSCGDIEANPGPSKTDREILLDLVEGQSKMTATIEAVLTAQNKIEDKLSTLTDRLDRFEKQLTDLNVVTNQVKVLETSVSRFDEQISELINKVDDLENRGRRNNLIIYGLEEPNKETYEQLEATVKDNLFHGILGLTVSGIERCHRLGRKTSEKPRPVILKFVDYREKIAVLKASYKLKDTNFSLSDDFSKRIREIRKQLWRSAAQEKEEGAKVKLLYDKLSIDGVLFGWNEEKATRFRLNKKTA